METSGAWAALAQSMCGPHTALSIAVYRNAKGTLKLSHWTGNHSMRFKLNVSVIYTKKFLLGHLSEKKRKVTIFLL